MASEKTSRKLQEEKHRQELELSNRKLATLAMQIMNKNEVLREIETRLNSSTDNTNLRKVNNLIKTSFNFDKNWEMLKRHFEKVHPGFFSGLKKKHPLLTDYDLRLAAYLKIHLTTKEIAQIINVTPAAINKSRQRLRKKMGIAAEVDFVDYFNSIL
jgi:DNA-binding CsgD family transcriptional regulator